MRRRTGLRAGLAAGLALAAGLPVRAQAFPSKPIKLGAPDSHTIGLGTSAQLVMNVGLSQSAPRPAEPAVPPVGVCTTACPSTWSGICA